MEEREQFEEVTPLLPGDKVLRVHRRRPRRRLRIAPNIPAFIRFLRDVATRTPLIPLVLSLVGLWLLFSLGIYFVERGASGSMIYSYTNALYWGIAAFSTAGIADTPVTTAGQIIGGVWIVVGSIIFFGSIVASVTAYFALPRRRPSREIISAVQYNLGELESLSADELEALRDVTVRIVDAQISRLKEKSQGQ